MRSSITTPAARIQRMEHSPSLATPLATSTRPSVILRSPATLLVAKTRPSVGVRSVPTVLATPIPPPVMTHYLSIPPAEANTANGRGALQLNTIGANNTANGLDTLENNTTGSGNTAIGLGALVSNTTGNNNIGLGPDAGSNVTTANNVICIGNVAGVNVNNTCFIANIFGATASGGSAVFINSNGQLGTLTSSRRFKEEIKPIEEASEALFSLKPVSFRYKKEIDPGSTPQLGLVAEDVEKVNPHLVVRDQEGKAYTVRYDQVNAMLLNEFLKEHRAFVEEQRTVAQQQTEIDALKVELKEQRSLIQKVSDRVEMKKSTTQIVSKP